MVFRGFLFVLLIHDHKMGVCLVAPPLPPVSADASGCPTALCRFAACPGSTVLQHGLRSGLTQETALFFFISLGIKFNSLLKVKIDWEGFWI